MTQASAHAYAPGTPIWVDLASTDLPGARAFYGQLFGWDAQEGPPEAGGYTMFLKDGKVVAAVGPIMSLGQPTAWNTYIKTADADASAQAVRDAGGQVLLEPMQVMSEGRLAVFMDPAGAAISVWEPQRMEGAELVNAPGSFCWNELNSRNTAAAKDFYPRVFGWGVTANPMGDAGEYIEWQVDGRSVAGGMAMAPQVPAEVPSFWLTYFAVEDCDAAAAKAQELGGRVNMAPMDSPAGRFAVLGDPQGGVFAVITAGGMAG